ncbi:MAG TPA: hypothetical protein DCQ64_19870 [Candidatus Rokubacteria bacterium]|nr:hypothetical protein [Candidatus Rokubacteria bacterium]
MWYLIAGLALGDVLVLALWLRERRQHRKSRTALRVYREASGLKQIRLTAVETDMAAHLEALRTAAWVRRAPRRGTNRIQLAKTGGAA